MKMTDMIKLSVDNKAPAEAECADLGKDNFRQPQELDDKPAFPGPLMSKTMQKEDLIRFIVHQTQKCLYEIDERNKVEMYFFWKIMELFCHQNGKVMMCEVAALLYRCYNFLRNKASTLNKWDDSHRQWCLPLAQLLCSTGSNDEHREAVTKMGDDHASRGLTYAAHICYVLAKVELGSRGQFDLIGYDSLPLGLAILTDPIIRTETYEYVLSLTSGLAQPNFQIFKLCYANRLAIIKMNSLVLAYCETIARAVIAFPGNFKRTFLERVMLLSCSMHKEQQQEKESDWLVELRRLHGVKVAKDNAKTEQQPPSTSSDPGSEIQDSELGQIPAFHFPDPGHHTVSDDELNLRYTLGKRLGTGGFSFVYAGERNDGKQVAFKFVLKKTFSPFSNAAEEACEPPLEVTLMKMLSQPPYCSHIVELLEWFEMQDYVVMVLERPSACMDLNRFIKIHNSHLSEAQARDIMLQVIQAAHHCCQRGVLHRDIKAKNLLISTDTMQVKLIDFGCGDLLKDTPYKKYFGTPAFAPPEFLLYHEYNGVPATIWGLGILLFNLTCGYYPFNSEADLEVAHPKLRPDVSRDLLELIMWCLEVNPKYRPTFEDLLKHEWFTEEVQDRV